MGLAAVKTRQKFGLDPRNTAWSNDQSRFGHKHLMRFGWQPGQGLGTQPVQSMKTHIKVSIKDDNLGLGAKLKKNKGDKIDEFDNGECAGLDVFQRILGRLNGKETEVNKELEIQRKDKILNGKWGVHFVKGDTLASTWDPKTKKLLSYSQMEKDSSSDEESDDDEDEKKKHKIEKKEAKKSKKRKRDSESDSESKKKKKSKKDKMEKKSKKDKKNKKEKESKKDKKSKHKKDKKQEIRTASIESSTSATSIPESVSTRLSVRSKWIKQKRAAVMDSKALNEIFMVTGN